MRILLVVATVIAVSASAQAFEIRKADPLSEGEAQELVFLFMMLREVGHLIEEGKDPLKEITGKTRGDLIRAWVARVRQEKAAGSGQGAPQAPPAQGELPAGHGFFLRNASVQGGAYPELIGELVNRSGRSYQFAVFTVSLYDKGDRLIGTSNAMVQNFAPGSTKTFTSPLLNVNASQVARYKVEYESGM